MFFTTEQYVTPVGILFIGRKKFGSDSRVNFMFKIRHQNTLSSFFTSKKCDIYLDKLILHDALVI